MLHYVTMLRCLQFQLWCQKNGWEINEKNHPPDAHIYEVSVCLAYLVSVKQLSLADALAYVKSKRPIARPNAGFLKQLLAFELETLGSTSDLPEDLLRGKPVLSSSRSTSKWKKKVEQPQKQAWAAAVTGLPYVLICLDFFWANGKLKLLIFNVKPIKLKQLRTGEVRPPTAGQVKSWGNMWCLVHADHLYLQPFNAFWYVLAFQVHILGNDITTVEGMKEAILWVRDFHVDVKSFLLSPGSGLQNSGCVPAGATYHILHVAAGYVGCFHFRYGFNCLQFIYCYYVFFFFFFSWGGGMEIDDLLRAG